MRADWIKMEGDANGAPRPGASAYSKKIFSGKYERRKAAAAQFVAGALEAFAQAMIDVDANI